MQQSFTIKDLMATPIPWVCIGLFSYLVGGTLFRNYLTRWLVRYYKNTQGRLDDTDTAMIQIARLFFPVSMGVFIIVRTFAFIGNTLCSTEKINEIAEKEYKK